MKQCTYICLCIYIYTRSQLPLQETQGQFWVGKMPWRRRWQPTPEIPWTEEPGRLQSMGSQRVRHDSATNQQLSLSLSIYIYTHIYVYIYYVTEVLAVQQKLIQHCKSTIISIKKKTCFSSSHSSTTIDPIFSFANLTLYSSYTSRHLFQISHS